MNPYFLITSSSNKDIQQALNKIGNQPFDWAYIGEDVKSGLLINELMPTFSKKLHIAEILQQTIREIKEDYVDYVGHTSCREDSMNWWLSWFSEKNPLFSKCFLYLSQTMTVIKLLKNQSLQKNPLLLIVSENIVRKCIFENLTSQEKSSIRVFDSSIKPSGTNVAFQNLINKLRMFYFLGRGLFRILISKYIFHPKNKIDSNTYTTVIVTFISSKNLRTETKVFEDNYFPNLASIARSNGNKVITLGIPLAGVSIIKISRYLRKILEPLTIPHHYLNFSDIFKAKKSMDMLWKNTSNFPLFHGINMELLIQHDQYLEKHHHRNAEAFLFYALVKRWKESDVKIERIIMPHEGHTWARAMIIGIKKYMPTTKIIGYQHTSIGETQLNYLISQNEISIVPIPDITVSSGPKAYQILSESGYSQSQIKLGGALRYSDALARAKSSVSNHSNRPINTILIATSIYPSEAAELLIKSINTFSTNQEITMIYKPHPALKFKRILEEANINALPSNLKTTEQSLLELLPNVTALLYTSSSSCAEGLATNTPLIHLVSEYGLDEDPLAFIPTARIPVSTEEQLREAFCHIQSNSYKSNQTNENTNLVFQLLEDISDASYTVFLD